MRLDTFARCAAVATLALVLLTGCIEDRDEALDGPIMAADTAEVDTGAVAGETLYAALQENERLTTMTQLVDRLGLDILLSDEDVTYTVFAPTDEAFETIEQITLTSLHGPDNVQLLREIVTAHLVQGEYTPDSLRGRHRLLSAGETALNIDTVNDSLYVDNAGIVEIEAGVSNGVLYVIDQVILPLEPSLRQSDDGV